MIIPMVYFNFLYKYMYVYIIVNRKTGGDRSYEPTIMRYVL